MEKSYIFSRGMLRNLNFFQIFKHKHVRVFPWLQFSICWTSFSDDTNKVPIFQCKQSLHGEQDQTKPTEICFKRVPKLQMKCIRCGRTRLHIKYQVNILSMQARISTQAHLKRVQADELFSSNTQTTCIFSFKFHCKHFTRLKFESVCKFRWH